MSFKFEVRTAPHRQPKAERLRVGTARPSVGRPCSKPLILFGFPATALANRPSRFGIGSVERPAQRLAAKTPCKSWAWAHRSPWVSCTV